MIQYQLIYKKKDKIGTYSTIEKASAAAKSDAETRYKRNFKSVDSFFKSVISNAYNITKIKFVKPSEKLKKGKKEYLYVGHYIDTNGQYILKIGTSKNLEERKKQHAKYYKNATEYAMPTNGEFVYDWFIKLSKYNTLRFEDRNREAWKQLGIGEYIRNDRFLCAKKPDQVEVKIRKTYIINL